MKLRAMSTRGTRRRRDPKSERDASGIDKALNGADDPRMVEVAEALRRVVDIVVGPDATFAEREAAWPMVAQEVARRAAKAGEE